MQVKIFGCRLKFWMQFIDIKNDVLDAVLKIGCCFGNLDAKMCDCLLLKVDLKGLVSDLTSWLPC